MPAVVAEYLNLEEVASALEIDPLAVRRLISKQILPAKKSSPEGSYFVATSPWPFI